MKKINNRETAIEVLFDDDKQPRKAFYSDIINMCLKGPKPGGYDFNDIEKRMKISDAIDAMKKKMDSHVDIQEATIDLEDDLFNYLQELVKQTKWNFIHADLLKFRDDLNSLK